MSVQTDRKKVKFHIDYALFGILLLFMVISLLSIYRAGEYLGYSTRSLALRQALWYLIGFGLIFVMSKISVDILYKLMFILYFVLLAMLALLIIVKYSPASIQNRFYFLIREVNGAWSWYQIPGLGTFQPSEFMKIVLIFICGDIINRHNLTIQKPTFKTDLRLFSKILLWALPPLALNFVQPDTGIPIIIVVSLIFMLYVGATKNYWFLALLISLVVLYFGVIYVYFNHPEILGAIFGKEGNQYKLGRFYGWLEYEKYAQTAGYQLYNALIALGMGGSSGVVDSTFIVHIAEAQNDFIFSVIGSQFGFYGSVGIIVLCILLDLKIIQIAVASIDSKSKYILGGLLGIFMFQQLQNMGMLVGLLPITGITLPLISSGGSSLLSYMIGLGYAFIVNSHTKNNPVYEESKMPSLILEQTSKS